MKVDHIQNRGEQELPDLSTVPKHISLSFLSFSLSAKACPKGRASKPISQRQAIPRRSGNGLWKAAWRCQVRGEAPRVFIQRAWISPGGRNGSGLRSAVRQGMTKRRAPSYDGAAEVKMGVKTREFPQRPDLHRL